MCRSWNFGPQSVLTVRTGSSPQPPLTLSPSVEEALRIATRGFSLEERQRQRRGSRPLMTPDALGDLLVGFVLAVLIPVAIGTISYGIRVVKGLRPQQRHSEQ